MGKENILWAIILLARLLYSLTHKNVIYIFIFLEQQEFLENH